MLCPKKEPYDHMDSTHPNGTVSRAMVIGEADRSPIVIMSANLKWLGYRNRDTPNNVPTGPSLQRLLRLASGNLQLGSLC